MAPKFGTSGLRGLVTELTDSLIAEYVHAFIHACGPFNAVHVGRDLRASSPRIAEATLAAIAEAGLPAIDHGELPTPALALTALQAGDAAVMVTGSHIPDDRNGLKFYVPRGEINKSDEAAIGKALGHITHENTGHISREGTALETFKTRYTEALGTTCLSGLKIGVYEHSSVARDVLTDILTSLGAETVSFSRSDRFIPVDTEAIDPQTKDMLKDWAEAHNLFAIVSTDGDGDRPMVADPNGHVIAGDVLGALTAIELGATHVVTPISSNSMIDNIASVTTVQRTKIGSPFVIDGMEKLLADAPTEKVVGYEANGGFLLGFNAGCSNGTLTPLMTRDCALPILLPLIAARRAQVTLTELVAGLPPYFTATDRLQNVPTDTSNRYIDALRDTADRRAEFFSELGMQTGTNTLDGLRVSFEDGITVHLRPSGNAPECRCYVEARDPQQAAHILQTSLSKLSEALSDEAKR